ncbi:extracellular solute-binding protein [Paenibacillus humicola]|uniref:extracellular solute-binding protein n=1 Tax=Paenibacillus humicola TaxID=3110540 RepID=UPI00237B0B63|nr:extracellular solute-binding protein [Paenibacillus humicola]
MKKRVLLYLSFIMMLGIAACSGSGGGNGTGGSGAAPETGGNDAGGSQADSSPIDVTMTLAAGPKTPDSWLEKELEKHLSDKLKRPVQIDSIMLPGFDQIKTKINLIMSDPKTMPDVIWYLGDMNKEYSTWSQSGIIHDLTPYLQQYGQNIISYYNKDNLFYSWDKSGKMFRVPADIGEPGTMTTILRKDWMDKLGLKVPTTVPEFIDVLRAFTNDDPDGNGKKDTYGFSGPAEWRSFAPILYAYKSNPDYFMVQDDGTVKYGAILPQTKEALRVLQGMYKEGLIDPRMLLVGQTDGSKFDDIMQQGKIGATYRWNAYFSPDNNVIAGLKATDPKAEIMSIEAIKGPDGFSSDYPEQVGGWAYLSITKKAEKPADVMQVLNEIASPESYRLIRFGKEGEQYKVENGKFKSLIDPEESAKLGLGNFDWYVGRKDALTFTYPPEVKDLWARREKTSDPMRKLRVEFKSLDRPAWTEYSPDIIKLRDETFYGIISGQRSIDDFDKFVDQYYKIGGKQVEEEANKLYAAQKEEYAAYSDWYDKNIVPYKAQ